MSFMWRLTPIVTNETYIFLIFLQPINFLSFRVITSLTVPAHVSVARQLSFTVNKIFQALPVTVLSGAIRQIVGIT